MLRQNGIIRVAVPDLERIARAYLQAMEGCLAGDETWKKRYDWVLLEMYDQANRDASGGEMMAYARQELLPDRDYVIERIGQEFHGMTSRPQHGNAGAARGTFAAIRDLLSRKLIRLFLGRDGSARRTLVFLDFPAKYTAACMTGIHWGARLTKQDFCHRELWVLRKVRLTAG